MVWKFSEPRRKSPVLVPILILQFRVGTMISTITQPMLELPPF